MHKCVIFDLDGTLTLSEEGILKSVSYACEKMNFPLPDSDTLKKFMGPPLRYSFVEYMGMTEEQALLAVEKYRERYNTIGLFENRVVPGMRSLLKSLKKNGWYVAIATGKPTEPSTRIAKHFGIYKFFDKIVGPDPDNHHAEKDKLIRQALPEDFDSEHDIGWMIGDRMFDIEGGKQLGFDTIGVGYGYGSMEELTGAGCTAFARSAREISDILMPGEKMPSGYFISMEGMDGCGKSTQMKLLEDNLSRLGFSVYTSREPGGCPVAEKIRSIILDKSNSTMTPLCEAYLYASSRAQHVESVIIPHQRSGDTVLCDRFVDSSVAYQGGGRQLGVDYVASLNSFAVGNHLPDLTIYLDIDYETSLARRKAATEPDRIEQEKDEFFARTEAAYHEIIKKDPERFEVVDARGSVSEVADRVIEAVKKRLFLLEDSE